MSKEIIKIDRAELIWNSDYVVPEDREQHLQNIARIISDALGIGCNLSER
mgnify:CR=1 FL=1